MIISFKTQTLCYSEDINELLCQIDVKLAREAENSLNASRYGAKICVDKNAFYILNKYRKILKDKADGSQCFCAYSLDDIISNIKQYLKTGNPQKFKTSISLDKSITTIPNTNSPIDIDIIYKEFGDHIVYNSVSNKYVTETVEDCWDQTDW